MRKHIRFLAIQEVLKVHSNQINDFGGSDGLRDAKLLDSAIHEPQATFSGDYLHKNIFLMAASYAQGIIKNHPFVDGNKRTGILYALIFLEYNDIEITCNQGQLYALCIDIATSKITLEDIAKFFRQNCLIIIAN